MADIFEALSQIRKASASPGATAVANTSDDSESPDNPRSGDIFSALDSVRSLAKPVKGRPPDEINPPIPPTSFAREMVKNAPGAFAQGASDLGHKVVDFGKTAIDSAKTAGGDIIDALDTIRQPGAARSAIEALPETGAQIAKDVGGTVAKAGAGLVKGATMGAIDPEEGNIGVPFTSIKKQVAPPLDQSLEALGVSPDIARNKYIQTAPEFVGAALPWAKISKAVGYLGGAVKAAAAGTEVAAPVAQTAEGAMTKLLGGSMATRAKQAAARVTQESITGFIYGLARVRGPSEDPLANAISSAKWGAGGSLGLEILGELAGQLKAKQIISLKDEIADFLYKTKQAPTPEAAATAASEKVLSQIYKKGGIENIAHEDLAKARDYMDRANKHFEGTKPKTEAPVDTTAETSAPGETAPPTTDIVPQKPPVVAPEATPVSPEPPVVPSAGTAVQAPTAGPEVYPEVTRLEADTTPGGEPVPASQPPDTHIMDALADIRKTEAPQAPTEPQALQAPPEQKGLEAIPKDLPLVDGSPKTGEPFAAFHYNDPISGQPYFRVYGEPGEIHDKTGGTTAWKSDLSLERIQELGLPIKGRTSQSVGLTPGVMDEAAAKLTDQKGFGKTVAGQAPLSTEQTPPAPPEIRPASVELPNNVFPQPKVPLSESITSHPQFIKVTNDALSVVKRYAQERGIAPGENYAKDLFHELHDRLGDVRTAAPEKRVQVAKEILSKYPNLEADFRSLYDKLAFDKGPEDYLDFLESKQSKEAPAETPQQTVPSGGGYALAPEPMASEPGPSTSEPKKTLGQQEFPETVPRKEPGPPEATHDAPIFELPEMVQLAKELMQGKFPQVLKNIRTSGGRALGVFFPGKGIIQIRADQFKNPEEAAHTLSHEIGHLADWLPDKNIMRGNIIGRIASLQNYMKDKFVGESFEKHLSNNKKFRNELISLTNRWHPFDADRAPKSYLAYRYSAPELYAEAWSVLLNNPKFLKDEAPAFYKAFFDYLDRKPDVNALYEDLGEVIKQGKTAETRHERDTAAYANEDLAAKLRNEAKGSPLRTIWDEIRESLVDENSKMISSVAKARKAGEHIPASENPLHALEDLRYSSAEMSDYAREQGDIYHKLKDAGIEWNDLGAYLKADRVINERSELANPGGQTPKAAGEEIDFLKKKYGEKFDALKTAADDMRGPRREYLIQELEKAEMVSPELLEKIKENKAYSPFDIIIKDSEKSLGGTSSNVGPQIYSQIGTLRDIKNPATALVMKDLSLLRAIRVQQAKMKQADWMLKHEPSWIVPAETKWNGVAHAPIEPADKENTGLLAFYQNGKIRAYYVPRTIADSFRYDPKEASLMMDCWDRMNSFFKQVFTAANPGFQVMNVPRDMSSLVMNLRGMSYSKALKYYVKVAGSAKRFAGSEHDDLVQEMLRRKVLITPQNRWSSVAHDVEMESIINRFSDKENEYEHWYSKVFGPLLDRVKMLGQMSEGISKIAGFRYLKDNQAKFGLSDEDINHLVRFQAGSPPFLVAGKQSRAIGRLLLFFNPHVQGYRRSFEAARLNPGEYAAKTIKYVFLPKLLQYLAWAGVFGAGVRATYRKVSSYNHANYHVIPLGTTDEGKAIALKIPMDDTERFYGGLLWYGLTSQPVAKTMEMLGFPVPKGDFSQDFTKLFSYTAGQAPNLTPALGALSDLVQYASGHIPYDSFRGKPAFPQDVFDAGGMRSHEAMLKYSLNQLGAGLIYRFNTSDVQKVKSNLEKVLGAPVIGNVASRFLMSTNFGESELIANRVAAAKKEDANQRLDYRQAVVENIMAHDKAAGPDEIAKLYGDMMKAGLLGDALHLKKFNEFQSFYKRLQSQRLDDPYANGLLFAKSDAEKGAILDVAKENLPKEDYDKLVGYSLTQKFIHAKTLVADEFRKASKK